MQQLYPGIITSSCDVEATGNKTQRALRPHNSRLKGSQAHSGAGKLLSSWFKQ